jgi:hypothetical protein
MHAAFARPVLVVSLVHGGYCDGCLTPRVCAAPEDYCPVLVGGIAQDLVQLHCEAVQVTNVERAEVAMERVVEQRLVDAEVHWWVCFGPGCRGTRLGSRRPLRGRCALLGVGEWRGRVRCVCVRC